MNKRDSRRKAQGHATDIAEEARLRGWTAADVFGAFAQVVANQNPMLARRSLDALEQVVRARIPMIASGPVMNIPAPARTN